MKNLKLFYLTLSLSLYMPVATSVYAGDNPDSTTSNKKDNPNHRVPLLYPKAMGINFDNKIKRIYKRNINKQELLKFIDPNNVNINNTIPFWNKNINFDMVNEVLKALLTTKITLNNFDSLEALNSPLYNSKMFQVFYTYFEQERFLQNDKSLSLGLYNVIKADLLARENLVKNFNRKQEKSPHKNKKMAQQWIQAHNLYALFVMNPLNILNQFMMDRSQKITDKESNVNSINHFKSTIHKEAKIFDAHKQSPDSHFSVLGHPEGIPDIFHKFYKKDSFKLPFNEFKKGIQTYVRLMLNFHHKNQPNLSYKMNPHKRGMQDPENYLIERLVFLGVDKMTDYVKWEMNSVEKLIKDFKSYAKRIKNPDLETNFYLETHNENEKKYMEARSLRTIKALEEYYIELGEIKRILSSDDAGLFSGPSAGKYRIKTDNAINKMLRAWGAFNNTDTMKSNLDELDFSKDTQSFNQGLQMITNMLIWWKKNIHPIAKVQGTRLYKFELYADFERGYRERITALLNKLNVALNETNPFALQNPLPDSIKDLKSLLDQLSQEKGKINKVIHLIRKFSRSYPKVCTSDYLIHPIESCEGHLIAFEKRTNNLFKEAIKAISSKEDISVDSMEKGKPNGWMSSALKSRFKDTRFRLSIEEVPFAKRKNIERISKTLLSYAHRRDFRGFLGLENFIQSACTKTPSSLVVALYRTQNALTSIQKNELYHLCPEALYTEGNPFYTPLTSYLVSNTTEFEKTAQNYLSEIYQKHLEAYRHASKRDQIKAIRKFKKELDQVITQIKTPFHNFDAGYFKREGLNYKFYNKLKLLCVECESLPFLLPKEKEDQIQRINEAFQKLSGKMANHTLKFSCSDVQQMLKPSPNS